MTTKPKKFKKVVKYDKFSSEDKSNLFTLSLFYTYLAGILIIVYNDLSILLFSVYGILPFITYWVVGGIYKILSRKVYWVEVKK